MNFKIIYLLCISQIFSIGLDALNIPINSNTLSTQTSTDIGVNSLSELFNENSFLEYNTRNWLPGITGHSIYWKTSSSLVKSVGFETMHDDEIFYHGSVPNDEENIKLPASWYSISLLFGKEIKNYNIGIKIQSFSNLLYTEKYNGLIANFYINKFIYHNIQIDFSLRNSIILLGNINNQSLPVQMNLSLQNNHIKIPISYGVAMKYTKLENSLNSFINYNLGFINFTGSIKYITDRELQYASGINLIYNQWQISYSLTSQLTSTLGTPQIFSIQYNFKSNN
ncbi:MAG: hypothetical protein H8E60_04735 [Candidatus Marinimicrobia bacterium]|nr:hypothetical protein [Candidatus Neomarinimicrobiota bacterium]